MVFYKRQLLTLIQIPVYFYPSFYFNINKYFQILLHKYSLTFLIQFLDRVAQ